MTDRYVCDSCAHVKCVCGSMIQPGCDCPLQSNGSHYEWCTSGKGRATLPAKAGKPTAGGPKCEKVSADAVSDANSRQIGGEHYRKVAGAPQHWDFVLAHGIPYMEAQIIKYLMRWRDKGGLQDLEKAKHFLEKLIEHESTKPV
jgi:hypothetical protein